MENNGSSVSNGNLVVAVGTSSALVNNVAPPVQLSAVVAASPHVASAPVIFDVVAPAANMAAAVIAGGGVSRAVSPTNFSSSSSTSTTATATVSQQYQNAAISTSTASTSNTANLILSSSVISSSDLFMNQTVAENWCYTHVKVTKFSYMWTINNF
uniref:Uncharacterized protein n=1 Tax=Romanomermis culicivorax TaxID=13658 RepID=A0A915ITJ6_ROMCU